METNGATWRGSLRTKRKEVLKRQHDFERKNIQRITRGKFQERHHRPLGHPSTAVIIPISEADFYLSVLTKS